MAQGVVAGVRLALGTLTIIPPGRFEVTRDTARWGMTLAPVAVLPLAVVAALVGWVGGLVAAPGLLIGAATIGALIWATRAMHADGLSDVVDGFGGGWTPERAREIMHRGDIGPMGAVTLALAGLAQAVAVGAIIARSAWGCALVGLMVVLSRAVLVVPCAHGRTPMPGSSLGKAMIGVVPRWVVAVWALVSAGALAGVAWAVGWPWWQGLLAVCLAWAAVFWLVARGERVFGGVNGDQLGASIEVAFTMMLVVMCCG